MVMSLPLPRMFEYSAYQTFFQKRFVTSVVTALLAEKEQVPENARTKKSQHPDSNRGPTDYKSGEVNHSN